MKKSLAYLKREAREAATSRGHQLSNFARISARLHVACCVKCQRKVQITTNPLPNEIDIAGEPVAIDCI